MDADEVMTVLASVATAIAAELSALGDWGLAGTRPAQYKSDIVADEVAVEILTAAGFGVLSEESGLHHEGRELLAVIDPIDGSTNASRALPWFATSICVVDEAGPFVAYVVNQATGRTYEAVRGRGARRDGAAITPSSATHLSGSIIGLSGFPGRHLGWMQYRVLGAIALDLCAVADGSLDGYLDCARSNHGVWDYLAGLLVCREAGAYVGETAGRELVVRTLEERRSPVAAGTEELLRELVAAHGGGAAE